MRDCERTSSPSEGKAVMTTHTRKENPMRYAVLLWIILIAIIAAITLPFVIDVAHALQDHAHRINDLASGTTQ